MATGFPVKFIDDSTLHKFLEVKVEEVQELWALLQTDCGNYGDLICWLTLQLLKRRNDAIWERKHPLIWFNQSIIYYLTCQKSTKYNLTLQFQCHKFLVAVFMPIGFEEENLWLVQDPLLPLRRSRGECGIVAVHCIVIELLVLLSIRACAKFNMGV